MGLSFNNFFKAPNFAWSDGFQLLRANEFNSTQIKNLDRNWNKEFNRLRTELKVKALKSNNKYYYLGSYYSSFQFKLKNKNERNNNRPWKIRQNI